MSTGSTRHAVTGYGRSMRNRTQLCLLIALCVIGCEMHTGGRPPKAGSTASEIACEEPTAPNPCEYTDSHGRIHRGTVSGRTNHAAEEAIHKEATKTKGQEEQRVAATEVAVDQGNINQSSSPIPVAGTPNQPTEPEDNRAQEQTA